MSESEKVLFTKHAHALDKIDELCPECNGELTIKHGKTGPFYGCVNYPSCIYTRQLVEHERVPDKELAGTSCPKCQHTLAVKQGRYGMFIGCTNYPACDHIEDTNAPVKADDEGVSCPSCKKGMLHEKTSRYGKIFYSCDQYPKCKYVLNFQPVSQVCPQCAWPIMVKRSMASGEVHICPQKKCGCKIKTD